MELHKFDLNVTLIDFTQAQYEKYQSELLRVTSDGNSIALFNRAILNAAKVAGILTGYTAEPENDKPVVVLWLSQEIAKFIREALTIPPN